MKFISILFLTILFWQHTAKAKGSEVNHIILIQNSGWMLPYYEDSRSNFKDVIIDFSSRLKGFGQEKIIVVSFNQSSDKNLSPKLEYFGENHQELSNAIKSIVPAKRPGTNFYTDTDFKEAIEGAITQFSPGKPAILWIFTNNKNSPNNSSETAEKNKEYYNFLQDAPEIRRIVGFPLKTNEISSNTNKDYKAKAIMIYGLAYGGMADYLLQEMINKNLPFGKQPARLKPLNSEALTFIPKGVSGNVEAGLVTDSKDIFITFSADTKPETAILKGVLRNDFYPHDIVEAQIKIEAVGLEFKHLNGDKVTAVLDVNDHIKIPSGALSDTLAIKLQTPEIPSMLNPKVAFGNGFQTKGKINIILDNQQLGISEDFKKELFELFPNDPLPDIFKPSEASQKSITEQNIIINVVYPAWPMFIVGSLFFILLGSAIFSVVFLFKEKIYRLSIDGRNQNYALKPFGKVTIKDDLGNNIGLLKRSFGQPTFSLNKSGNHSVRFLS